MATNLLLGIGMSVVTSFIRWRVPAIPKPLATAGLVVGFGLIAWSQIGAMRHLWGAAAIGGLSLIAALADWKFWHGPETQKPSEKPKRPTRDIPFTDAFIFAVLGEWGKSIDDVANSDLADLGAPLREIHQLALDGELTIWGKETPHSLYVPIHKRFWRDHQVEWFDMLKGTPRTERTDATAANQTYWDLMVCKAEFECFFPRP